MHTLAMRRESMPSNIIHIPHSSTTIPAEYRDQFVLTDAELAAELVRMTDAYTDELFAMPGDMATTVRFPVSRLVVDPERFEDDSQEPMSRRGMGVIYTRSSMGAVLRREVSPGEREALLAAFYRPHHAALTRAVGDALDAHGKCLIIDGHSFASRPWPYEPDQTSVRPEICIGTDDFHTPDGLTRLVVESFRGQGFTVDLNRPFAGALVPLPYYRKNPGVRSIMVEVRRDLYTDEATGGRSAGFGGTVARVQAAIREVAGVWDG
ncbi:MAG: hypothetical protein RIQ81_157 [Pseudomonadota bacterium]|jgi:N-formylglutamate amidohydrolase